MLNFPDIKLGAVVNFNNHPCVIVSCEFLRMQQRKPVKKCKLKNLVTGLNTEYSFKTGDSVEEADLHKSKASFMYQAADVLSFMLDATFETVEVPAAMLGSKTGYLKDGLEVLVVYFNGEVIAVELPIKISYTVIQTSDAVKGNSVSDIMKDATIETGAIVKVPAFIKEGEKIMVNTSEDEYASRDSDK